MTTKYDLEYVVDGFRVTYNDTIRVGYISVQPSAPGQVARTIELSERINVDLDSDERITGIEVFGEPTLGEALQVLAKCCWDPAS